MVVAFIVINDGVAIHVAPGAGVTLTLLPKLSGPIIPENHGGFEITGLDVPDLVAVHVGAGGHLTNENVLIQEPVALVIGESTIGLGGVTSPGCGGVTTTISGIVKSQGRSGQGQSGDSGEEESFDHCWFGVVPLFSIL